MMKKRIVLIGSQGMLGMQFLYDFEEEFEIIPLSRFHLDLEDTESIAPEIIQWKPHVIVNTAAWTAVDKAENPKFHDRVQAINVDAVAKMATAAKELQIPLFHVSTDFVFGGESPEQSFAEDDRKHPMNMYGTSKSAGEDAALEIWNQTYIIRTAWLYGEYGPNFVERILHVAKKNPEVQVVNDQFGNPTWARDVAATIALLIQDEGKRYTPSIYHAVSELEDTPPSWYDFTQEIFRLKKITKPLHSATSASMKQIAKRPVSSVLKNTKLPKLKDWKTMLAEYLG